MYRIFAGDDGESHIEELDLAKHPELSSLTNVAEVRVAQHQELRDMDFHPLPERRLIIHMFGEVEIGFGDGTKHIFRAGDARLMEDTTGRGHTHRDLSPNASTLIILKD
jgi:hypothetical protein